MRLAEAHTIILTPATTVSGRLLNAQAHLVIAHDLLLSAKAAHAALKTKDALRLAKAALTYAEREDVSGD